MAKKKNSRSGRQGRSKSNQRGESESAIGGLSETFDEAAEAVERTVNRIPRTAVYWGLGAIAVGAAAVGAYIYLDRIAEMYETASESSESDESDTDISSSKRGSVRSTTSSSPDLSELERH